MYNRSNPNSNKFMFCFRTTNKSPNLAVEGKNIYSLSIHVTISSMVATLNDGKNSISSYERRKKLAFCFYVALNMKSMSKINTLGSEQT